MVESGQVWASGGRTVLVLATDAPRVVVRDSYGWRRSLTEDELEQGFSAVSAGGGERARGVMACRALADVEPA